MISEIKYLTSKLIPLIISDRFLIYYPPLDKNRGVDISTLFDSWLYN